MRPLLRTFLIAILIVALTEAPVLAGSAQPLGMVVQAEHARLGTAEALVGATVFGGDSLSTELNGSLMARFGWAQFYLRGNTSATVGGMVKGVNATLQRGTLLFSSEGTGVVDVHVSDALIRSRNGEPVYAAVRLIDPNEFEIASYRGTVDVVIGNETHAVTEKTAYRVLLEPQQAPGGAAPAGRRGKFIAILFFLGATLAAILIARHFVVSPDSP